MLLVDELIETKEKDVLSALARVGFRKEQAEWFLFKAGESLQTAIFCARNIHDTESVMNAVDVAALSEDVRMKSGIVCEGLGVLVPYLLEGMGEDGLRALSDAISKAGH